MNLLSILKALGIKISPQIEEAIAKAQQLANNYGNSKEGFIKIDTARTQYMIENTAKQTQEQAMALANALGTKIDFYEYQNLRDQLAQERTKNVVLENRVYSDAKFNALERQNEAMFGVLKSEIADLSCNVPKRPPYYAQGFVACGSPIPNGCCN